MPASPRGWGKVSTPPPRSGGLDPGHHPHPLYTLSSVQSSPCLGYAEAQTKSAEPTTETVLSQQRESVLRQRPSLMSPISVGSALPQLPHPPACATPGTLLEGKRAFF